MKYFVTRQQMRKEPIAAVQWQQPIILFYWQWHVARQYIERILCLHSKGIYVEVPQCYFAHILPAFLLSKHVEAMVSTVLCRVKFRQHL